MELLGRGAETAVLDRLLERAADGAGSGLLLWGEPGIGKTALLEHAVGAAPCATVLRCRGTRMEAGLAFAALHELLWPVTDRLGTLPAPQAAALHGALGLSGETANRFLIGAAVLSLVSDLAAERPVLVVVDDVQWIDEASAHALGFLARRVANDPVLVLLSGHEDPASGPWDGLAALRIGGLADDDARSLVAAAVPGADDALIDDTVRTAGGNPLALHELPTLDRAAADDTSPRPPGAGVPIGPRLRRAFRDRVAAMPEPARALLLLAAAEDRGDRLVVDRAGTGRGVDASAWEDALRSGLIRTSGSRVEFRHPLIPAAIYEGATFPDRQAAHRALAAAQPTDAIEERAWHMAAAADAPDEEIAALLELAAGKSLRCGAGPAGVRALRRAAELSQVPAEAARRLAAAARAAWDAGQAEAARQLLDDAERLESGTDVARASSGLRGILEFTTGIPERAHQYLTRDMSVAPRTRDVVQLGSVAVRAAWSAGRTDLQQETLQRLLAVEADDDPALTEQLPALRALWSCYDQTGEFSPITPDRAHETTGRLVSAAWELLPPAPLVQIWGVEGPLRDALRVQAAALRERHELAALAVVLSQGAVLDLAAGQWGAAESAAIDGLHLADEVGADHVATQCRGSLALLAAARGDERTVEEYATRVLEISVPQGVRAFTSSVHWIRGRVALFAGRPDEALEHLMPVAQPGHDAAHPTFVLLAAADTAEAAVHVGRLDLAESRLTTVQAWARHSGAPWAQAIVHRLSALIRGGQSAEASYRTALDLAEAAGNPFEQARTRMLYGEWLRRARRRSDARRQLAAAAAVFDRLGADPLRRRALREQDLADGPTLRRGPGSSAGLTAQELRVARLASDHLTNREIAAQLLISPRTVGHHLANVYPKLGITSRTELSRVDLAGDLRLRVDARGR
ncbi:MULTISPECIES: helix-turn-helix transcriptional regulator [Pseudonocardia]|uniref:LuxR family transcriptional regulator n=2 Tax=Pseudonocardia TaxID=1847 RepID=A0ABQ0S114_9PSEU|nr:MULTISPECIES: LuxR family transcriptional regulator [Pseudonocardia]OSY36260.1 putative HTH-type transcriptional regulator [Pseudonocardia autotrophica]TDN73068.1 regulatory LuxR family protein [Pseudonocardia autotrophica]BBG03786.1 LuxR family transcriptional regulator [Pseudonocardia autotrophica]GEC26606.1 LuxR family transcriptional regulator [Pseudonocardia saturnea]